MQIFCFSMFFWIFLNKFSKFLCLFLKAKKNLTRVDKLINAILLSNSAKPLLNIEVTVKVFSSLTCPHCASFHITVFDKLKKDYIDQGLVKFEHHAFPLDLAALNAEVIVRCATSDEKKFQLLHEMYGTTKSLGCWFRYQ